MYRIVFMKPDHTTLSTEPLPKSLVTPMLESVIEVGATEVWVFDERDCVEYLDCGPWIETHKIRFGWNHETSCLS